MAANKNNFNRSEVKENRLSEIQEKKSCSVSESFLRLVDIMSLLRGEGGCNWDRKQTISDIASYVYEEACEVIDAIHCNDKASICEELGDLMLQIVFIARIAQEDGLFNIADVCNGISDKLIFRHPHIFSDKSDLTPDQVVDLWNKKKREEAQIKGADQRGKTGVLRGVSLSQPALKLAETVQKKAATSGFDWPDISGVKEKVNEELEELEEALESGNQKHVDEEFGDLLFTMVNLSRFIKIDSELSLRKSTLKFMDRFRKVEALAEKENRNIEKMSLEEMDALWNRIKKE